MNDLKLKACPFCGGIPEVVPWHGGEATKVMIYCPHNQGGEHPCPVSPEVTGETLAEATDRWNTRPEEDELRRKLAEAIAVLEECEWADNSGQEYTAGCPICECYFDLHAPDCKLAALLKGEPPDA